jgi:Phage integrase SAM-like domain
MNITFYFKKSQGNLKAAKGYGIIHYYTYENNTKTSEKSTGIRCHYTEFDSDAQCFVGESSVIRNRRLNEIKNKFDVIISSKESLTQTDLLDFNESIHNKNGIRLLKKFTEVVDEWLELQKTKLRKDGEKRHIGNIEKSTYYTYKKRYDNIYEFLRVKNLLEINVSKFDAGLCEQFDFWCINTLSLQGKKRGQDYSTKHLKLIRTIMDYAQRAKYITINPTHEYKLVHEPGKTVETISNIEIMKLEKYQGFHEIEEKYIDAFLFMRECFLHFGDYYELQDKHLTTDEKGNKLIVKDRCKRVVDGRTVQIIPLSEKAEKILNKYGGNLSNLPRARNPVMAKYIKIACAKAGIERNVKIKFARSNGISNIYNINKARAEQVAIVAGWTKTDTLKYYRELNLVELRKEILNIA